MFSKKIIIASHRRSGTHLTIDTIVNNFSLFNASLDISRTNLDKLSQLKENKKEVVKNLQSEISNIPCIFKTHTHGNINNFFEDSTIISGFIQELFDNSKIIYVYRDGRDVITSLYYYHQTFDKTIKKMTFTDYLKSINNFDDQTYSGNMQRASYWAFHVNSWLNQNNYHCLMLSFDDFHRDFLNTLKRIAEFIDEPLQDNIKDTVVVSQGKGFNFLKKFKKNFLPKKFQAFQDSSVHFRKGISGEWQRIFSLEDIKVFEEQTNGINQKLGYK